MNRQHILLEAGSTHEGRAVLHAAMLADVPVTRLSVGGLGDHAQALRSGSAVPVGAVEFVREAMRVGGIVEPWPLSYPAPLLPFLGRRLERTRLGLLGGRCFVKPMKTKLFTGFVYDASLQSHEYTDHDQEQLQRMKSLPASEPVWRCEEVRFLSEWRFYIHDHQILGRGRYDPDGADDAPQPDEGVVKQAVAAMRKAGIAAYALDMGVLATGRTVLVEANDAWALGLYGRALPAAAYWGMLRARWQQIHEKSSQQLHPIETRPQDALS